MMTSDDICAISKSDIIFLQILLCVTKGVSHCGLAIYIEKYLKAKLKYFTIQKYNLPKIL
jgi:hypothetical protein